MKRKLISYLTLSFIRAALLAFAVLLFVFILIRLNPYIIQTILGSDGFFARSTTYAYPLPFSTILEICGLSTMLVGTVFALATVSRLQNQRKVSEL